MHQVLDVPCYGIALGGPWVYLALYCHTTSIVVRGDRLALTNPGYPFNFREIYRLQTQSTNERIHGMFLGSEALWVANTGRNSLLKIDPDDASVIAEIPVILDCFGAPIFHDCNHINSVAEYDGTVLFVAYRAGSQSMIGVYDGATVTGYAYHRAGVHDIYLTESGFVLCDTFGANTATEGGAPITEKGPLDSEYFSRPPGCIVRGVAGSNDELLIGHSHKGTRARRFEGHGAILIARNGKIVQRIEVRPAQIYQVITESGAFTTKAPIRTSAASIQRMLQEALGEPIYQASIATKIDVLTQVSSASAVGSS